MKKNYTAPAMEINAFDTESIVTGSFQGTSVEPESINNQTKAVAILDYKDLGLPF